MLYFHKAFLSLIYLNLFFYCVYSDDQSKIRVDAASKLAMSTMNHFYTMFDDCVQTPMPKQDFAIDDLEDFINNPAKTTVGFAPKFTENRKFFANMISSTEFKEMLNKDVDKLRKKFVNKLQYCDGVVMDNRILSDFYDRETDMSKL